MIVAAAAAAALLAGLLAGIPALAGEQDLQVLPLRHRAADQLAAAIGPLLAADEVLVPAGDRLLLRARPTTVAQVQALLAELDRPRRSLQLQLRLHSSAAAASADGQTPIRVQRGSERQVARAVSVGQEGWPATEHSISTVRVLEDGEAWVSLRHLQGLPAIGAPLLTVAVRGPQPIPSDLAARVILMPSLQQPPWRHAGGSLRVAPQLRGETVVAELTVVAAAAADPNGRGLLGFQGQVQLPLGRWFRIAHATASGELHLDPPSYPDAVASSRQAEIWARFELVP